MDKPTPSYPGLVTFSIGAYRLLLIFYPNRFRMEYGPHMAQVFKDCCLRTYRQSGPLGMLVLWSRILFDWIKTVIEERLNRETEMTRAKRIRLSGWSLMAGPLALFVGLGEPAQYRRLLVNLFGIPVDHQQRKVYWSVSEAVPTFLVATGLALILFGFWGLYSHYHPKVGRLGRVNLRLVVVNSGISALGGILSVTGSALWWIIFLLGFFAAFLFLGFFGISAVRERPLSRWNALPLITGFWLPTMLVIGLLLGWDDQPNSAFFPMLCTLLGAVLIGYVLQSDAKETAIS